MHFWEWYFSNCLFGDTYYYFVIKYLLLCFTYNYWNWNAWPIKEFAFLQKICDWQKREDRERNRQRSTNETTTDQNCPSHFSWDNHGQRFADVLLRVQLVKPDDFALLKVQSSFWHHSWKRKKQSEHIEAENDSVGETNILKVDTQTKFYSQENSLKKTIPNRTRGTYDSSSFN